VKVAEARSPAPGTEMIKMTAPSGSAERGLRWTSSNKRTHKPKFLILKP
jgi:hypothetical protein